MGRTICTATVIAFLALYATEARADPHRVCLYLELGPLHGAWWAAAAQMELDR